jgi:hypothetical protein
MTEAELCEYLAANHFSDCKKVDETYSTWDVTFTADTKIGEIAYYAELKCRKTHYDSLLIEEDKYKRLISAAAANGRHLGIRLGEGWSAVLERRVDACHDRV